MTTPKFRDHFSKSQWLGFHWLAILAVTGLIQFGINLELRLHGVSSMAARNLAAMPLAYGSFLALVRAWVGILGRTRPEVLTLPRFSGHGLPATCA